MAIGMKYSCTKQGDQGNIPRRHTHTYVDSIWEHILWQTIHIKDYNTESIAGTGG
jgi:hypothetical protein